MRMIAAFFIALGLVPSAHADLLIDFESLPTGGDGYYNGDVGAGAPLRDNYTVIGSQPGLYGGTDYTQVWNAGGAGFSNEFNSQYENWSGWSWSNVQDTTTPGYSNQYAAITGGGADSAGQTVPGGTYAVGFGSGYINLPTGMVAKSVDITNATYAALSMQDGDGFAKQFGGASGNDPDFFNVILSGFDGLDGTGNLLGEIVVSLADYTFADNSQDYILTDWLNVDLSSLGGAKSIAFSFDSSDTGAYGMNTPAYFAMDNLTVTAVPEPSMLVLLGTFAAAAGAMRCRRKS